MAWWGVAVVLVTIGVVYARARWPGFLPIGSDNDEYQLAGQALTAFERPLIAGVEGTKYPLGYPAVLAVIAWLGLPMAPVALVLNLVGIAATAAMVTWLVGRATPTAPASPGAGLAAGSVVITSVSVWNDAFSVMPEVALLTVATALLLTLDRPLVGRRLWLAVALAVVAVTLKTLAVLLLVGGCAFVWLVAHRRPELVGPSSTLSRSTGASSVPASPAPASSEPASPAPVSPVPTSPAPASPVRLQGILRPALLRARALLPAVAGVLAVLGGMLLMRPLPDHTTGYLATFALRDPFDASRGELGVAGLLRRAIADVPTTLTDLGRAIALIDAGTSVAVVVAIIGLTFGVLAAFRLRPRAPLGPFVAGATLAYVGGMMAWPYHSSRFGIPLVPVAAIGAGWLVRLLTDRQAAAAGDHADPGDVPRLTSIPSARGGVSMAVGAGVCALLVTTSWEAVETRGDTAGDRLAEQHAALETLERFAEDHLTDEQIVSFDYREVSHRLDRPVHPLAYTSDTSALLEQVGDAEVLVMVDIHHTRNRQLERLLEAEPDRFTPLLEQESVAVYRVEPWPTPPEVTGAVGGNRPTRPSTPSPAHWAVRSAPVHS